MEKIKIKIDNAKYKKLTELKKFQGNLKEVTPARMEKLKNNILKNGFIAPVFLWSGKNYILDGHTRIQAVKELLEEGHELETVDEIPIVEINASSEKQAAQYILAYSSQYNIITEDGFKEFLTDFDMKIEDFKAEVICQRWEKHTNKKRIKLN